MGCSRSFALATAAVALFLAFAGTNAAMGSTKLCASAESTENECPTGKAEYSGAITATSANPVLTTNSFKFTCEGSAITTKASSSTNVAPSTSISGEVSAMSFSECGSKSLLNPCTISAKNLPYHAEIQGTSEGDANKWTLKMTDEVGIRLQILCAPLLLCEYQTKELWFLGTNGNGVTSEFSAARYPFSFAGGSGAFCSLLMELDADYSVTSPKEFTVR